MKKRNASMNELLDPESNADVASGRLMMSLSLTLRSLQLECLWTVVGVMDALVREDALVWMLL